MARATVDMVEEFARFSTYVERLKALEESYWTIPLEEGKWSLKDVISHMMLWDKYFYEQGIHKITLGEAVTVRSLNFDEFNADAARYAQNKTRADIVDEFCVMRQRIIAEISGLTEEAYTRKYKSGDGKTFAIRGYLQGFIPHDKHHRKQIQRFIKNVFDL
ncbi:DinB family protein [Paenibacillus massiliensis]|uniref:DinB family protein n=1 Tax=Paenibacillus massiliensis TaxID=225917 RepID=UPI0003FB26CD|nr:DinB family protein [Paenibacillus massiliensis]